MKSNVIVEFQGKQIAVKDMIDTAKKTWKKTGKKVTDLNTMSLYVKPEENAVYYVFNDSESGNFNL